MAKLIKGRFLRGPIPWNWLEKASLQHPKGLHVAINIWFLRAVTKRDVFSLSNKILREMGVSRQAKNESLKKFKEVGLVDLKQETGRSPVVTIKDII
jgi:hypothetical protein